MASTPADRLALLQQIYQDALLHETEDLAAATTPAQVTAIQINVFTARQAYYANAVDTLTATGPAVEAAYTAAQTALTDVKNARTAAASIATILQKLSGATAAGTNLLNTAKSV
jgi:hypothetical protein